MAAIEAKKLRIVKMICDRCYTFEEDNGLLEAQKNGTDSFGNNSLHYAIKSENYPIIEEVSQFVDLNRQYFARN
jgi:hypothetical protein